MPDAPCNLAIETSGRAGSVALGRGDTLLGVASLGEARRHNLVLLPTIDTLCREHGVTPRDLGELYVALGPGSFTGLRVGVTTAKMLALTTAARVVGVPTLDTLAAGLSSRLAPRLVALANHDGSRQVATLNTNPESAVAIGLNLKRGTLYSAVFRGGVAIVSPALRTLDELLAAAPRPLALIAEKLPDGAALPDDVTRLPPEAAVARAEVLWTLGRAMAAAGRFTPPAALVPLYVREPEAVTLWDERHGQARSLPRP